MSTPVADANAFAPWIGRREEAVDVIDPRPMRLMQTTLNHPPAAGPGTALPPLWHWLYFPPQAPVGSLGADGHPERGDFLPPVTLPRRMWAGGRFTFAKALRVGETVNRVSTIQDIKTKRGRSGELCFITLNHRFSVKGEFRFSEEYDVVFRDKPAAGVLAPPPQAAPDHGDWERRIEPSAVLLFRYSALTFNSHRIHYDLPYCQHVEGYPGLVFHGPLTATLLVELLRENNPDAWISEISIRAVSPLFDIAPFTIAGRRESDTAALWARNPEGGLAMQMTAVLS